MAKRRCFTSECHIDNTGSWDPSHLRQHCEEGQKIEKAKQAKLFLLAAGLSEKGYYPSKEIEGVKKKIFA